MKKWSYGWKSAIIRGFGVNLEEKPHQNMSLRKIIQKASLFPKSLYNHLNFLLFPGKMLEFNGSLG